MRKQRFQTWFGENGNELLRGWLRAREDGNTELFSDWILGEYDYYRDVPHEEIEDDSYEIPYHGLCDSPAKIELELYPPLCGVDCHCGD